MADTPMMRQWSELKSLAGDSLLFFRLGDFYELFDTDAETAAPILGIVLTSRNQKNPDAVSLCGIPLHQFDNYIGKLLDRGFSVALAEQTEEVKPGKNLVRREIVQTFTPGIRLLPLDDRPHFAAFLTGDLRNWAIAAADVCTGEILTESGSSFEELQELVARLPVQDLRSEAPLPENLKVLFHRRSPSVDAKESENLIFEHLCVSEREDFPSKNANEQIALGSLLRILKDAHPRERLKFFSQAHAANQLKLSAATRRNLNLFEPAQKNLFEIIDRTVTAFGRRELKHFLAEPLNDVSEIQGRQKIVSYLKAQNLLRKNLRERMRKVLDLPRLLRRERGPRELFRLKESLESALEAIQVLTPELELFKNLKEKAQGFEAFVQDLRDRLNESEDPEIGWIKAKVLPELDELRSLEQDSQKILSAMEENLRTETKISALKVKFHQVLGYVFEVSANHRDKIPAQAQSVQNLANSIRFKTAELQNLEEKLLSVSTRIREAESAEISRLYGLVREKTPVLMEFVALLSTLDALQSFAEISNEENWTTPETIRENEKFSLELKEGSHPMIAGFVPLSVDLATDGTQMILLTGPNMAGKSTLMRMTALQILLHQIGSDVPAKKFKASLFDRLMCRMGAQDDLSSGQSTFFVEMREVAQMLNGADEKSFLLFDEIGRGTSTYDGMSLAWAIGEAIHDSKSLSIVATHYLELADLERRCPRLKPFHLGVEEQNGKLVFTRKLVQGPASRSYGIQVARLADIPESILERASSKLQELERKRTQSLPLFEWRPS